MELTLTRPEVQTLVLAIGTAIQKESDAVHRLQTEARRDGIANAIAERTKLIADLDGLRRRLNGKQ